MRIGDAVNFSTERLEGNRLFLLHTENWGSRKHILPRLCFVSLGSNAKSHREVFLLERERKARSIVRSWQTRLRRLFKLANIPSGHAHRFRDTFAVELLLAGVPIERVSILLSHQSVRITEKHYAPWVRSRKSNWRRIWLAPWSRDPLVLLHGGYTRGTRKQQLQTTHSFQQERLVPGWESNPHEEKSPEDFKSSASAIPPPGLRPFQSSEYEGGSAIRVGSRESGLGGEDQHLHPGVVL